MATRLLGSPTRSQRFLPPETKCFSEDFTGGLSDGLWLSVGRVEAPNMQRLLRVFTMKRAGKCCPRNQNDHRSQRLFKIFTTFSSHGRIRHVCLCVRYLGANWCQLR